MDFITNFTITFYDRQEEISEKNYKEFLTMLEYGIAISENDNEILDERIEELIENFPNRQAQSYIELEEKYTKLQQQREENREYIRKCENTIELIQKFAEIREWI